MFHVFIDFGLFDIRTSLALYYICSQAFSDFRKKYARKRPSGS